MVYQVREEQRRLRPDIHAPITGEVLNEMVYTRQVVKEVLRFRPPAPMVPQVAPTCMDSSSLVIQILCTCSVYAHKAHLSMSFDILKLNEADMHISGVTMLYVSLSIGAQKSVICLQFSSSCSF